MNSDHDFVTEITFLPTEKIGRKGVALSGYRGQFYYDGMIGTQSFFLVAKRKSIQVKRR
jgi:hypothetical protein